jgi:membrane fusion protein (multidrug efflux system)
MKSIWIRLSWSLALAVSLLITAGCGDQGGGQGAVKLTVMVTPAERRDMPLTIDMVGTTLGTQDVPIRARVEGFLESMDFEEGTFVSKGDLLYTIDPQPFQAKLVEAQSGLAAAQTRLAKADADLDRIRPLAEMNAVSQQDLDGAVAQEAAARASVRASEAAVDLAEIELSYTRIIAPIDGLIGISKARPGEFVGRDPNPVVLNTLSDIDPIRVRFSISEREYLVIARTYMESHAADAGAPGQRRSARKQDLQLILADGSVHDHRGGVVAAAQSIDVETGTYTLEAAFPNPTGLILPGQFARVRALYQVLEDAVVIPRQALVEMQGLFRVYVVNEQGTVEAREVQKGPESGQDLVIESGLQGGERVIVEGLQRVRPGMTVNVEDWTPPASNPRNG